MEVRMEYLRPTEIEQAMAACPVLFQPLGTIEWHGRHNWVGLDAVKAHRLCVLAAEKGGGLVAPALYGGMGGLEEPHTFVIEPENALFSNIFRAWIERLAQEAIRNGFKAVIFLTGHYGASQQIILRDAAVHTSRALNKPILGNPEYFLALDEGYIGDHAAYFETSIMMHLFPESVDLNQLGEEPHQGVGGKDPKKFANATDGKRFCDAIIQRLVSLAKAMPAWDQATLDRFIQAETALVNKQVECAGKSGQIWSGWRLLGEGVFSKYPVYLEAGNFEGIIELTSKL